MINELKKRLEELEILEAISDKADAEFEADPENFEKEKFFEKAYKAELKAYMEASKLIANMAKIDIKTTQKIVKTKRDKILNFIA